MMNQDYPVSPPDNLPVPDADRHSITPADLELHARWLRRESGGVRLVRVNVDLRRANLYGANLCGANLRRANLYGADLYGANLCGANLYGANLYGANLCGANLYGANLSYADLRNAYLSNADLRNADLRNAYLSNADLRNANLRNVHGLPIASDSAERLKAVANAALQPGALEMSDWHSCGTTHCIAGWAIHLAGEPGRVMQKTLGHHMAAMLLLGVEAAEHFYDSNEEARQWLESVVAS